MTRGFCVRAAVVLLAGVFWGTLADAQFHPPVQVSADATGNIHPEIAASTIDNVTIVFEKNGGVFYTSSALGFGSPIEINPDGVQKSHPTLALGSSFLIDVAYEQIDPMAGGGDSDIVLIDNNGGAFSQPVTIVNDANGDHLPAVLVDGLGNLNVGWESDSGSPPSQILLRQNLGTQQSIADGAHVQFADLGGGTLRIAYQRDGIIYDRTYDGGAPGPEQILADLPGVDESPRIDSDSAGATHAVFVNGGELYYTQDSGTGTFSTPQLLDSGPITGEARIAAGDPGHVVIVWSRGGQIYFSEGTSGNLAPGIVISGTTTGAEDPVVALDTLGNPHVAYEDGGAIFYLNDIPPPVANFTAMPNGGQLPLTVNFNNTSTGVITDVLWDFGDGSTSAQYSPSHVYLSPGTFTVSLTVSNPGGSDVLVKNDHILATLPPNVLHMPTIHVFAGEPGVVHPIYASFTDPLQGFQVSMIYDETVTPVSDITLDGSITASLNPEFIYTDNIPSGANSVLVVAVILDVETPFDGRTIPPGSGRVLASLMYDVPNTVPFGTTTVFHFQNGLTTPPINNIFSAASGVSISPYLYDGSTIVDATVQFLFKRGDANYNQAIDIADAIYLLNFLFAGGAAPVCPDSADVNDTGVIDIADAIYLLSYLFSNAPPPSYPYPGVGVDPTPDSLGPCQP